MTQSPFDRNTHVSSNPSSIHSHLTEIIAACLGVVVVIDDKTYHLSPAITAEVAEKLSQHFVGKTIRDDLHNTQHNVTMFAQAQHLIDLVYDHFPNDEHTPDPDHPRLIHNVSLFRNKAYGHLTSIRITTVPANPAPANPTDPA